MLTNAHALCELCRDVEPQMRMAPAEVRRRAQR